MISTDKNPCASLGMDYLRLDMVGFFLNVKIVAFSLQCITRIGKNFFKNFQCFCSEGLLEFFS